MTAWRKNDVKPPRQLIDYALTVDLVRVNFDWAKATEFYQGYSYEQLKVLLEFVESLLFHSLVILLDSDKSDKEFYRQEMEELIKSEGDGFGQERRGEAERRNVQKQLEVPI